MIGSLLLSSALAAPALELPLRLADSGHLLVEGSLGGEDGQGWFILDSAASVTVLHRGFWEQTGRAAPEGREVKAKGAGGDLSQVQLVILEGLELGDQSYPPQMAVLMDLSSLEEHLEIEVAGLLGRTWMKDWLVEVNPLEERLRVYDPQQPPSSEGFQAHPTRRARAGLMRTELDIDGVRVQAIVDLGAGASVMNLAAAEALGFDPESAEPSADPIIGAENKETPGWQLDASTIRAGEHRWSDRSLLFSDLEVFEVLRMHRKPAMIMGLDLLQDQAVRVDFGGKTLWLGEERVPAQAEGSSEGPSEGAESREHTAESEPAPESAAEGEPEEAATAQDSGALPPGPDASEQPEETSED